MTTVTIGSGYIEISGHAEEPVVCHGVSAIAQMVANYVEDHKWGRVERGDGYLKIYDVEFRYHGNPLFKAMTSAIVDISEEYPGNIVIQRER